MNPSPSSSPSSPQLNSPSYLIRQYQPKDFDVCRNLFASGQGELRNPKSYVTRCLENDLADIQRSYLSIPRSNYWCAVDRATGKVIGTVAVHPLEIGDDEYAEIIEQQIKEHQEKQKAQQKLDQEQRLNQDSRSDSTHSSSPASPPLVYVRPCARTYKPSSDSSSTKTLTTTRPLTPFVLYPPSSICELRRMVVDPSFRSQGIAVALLRTLVEFAREVGYKRVHLTNLDHMESSIRLYQRSGFKLEMQEMFEVEAKDRKEMGLDDDDEEAEENVKQTEASARDTEGTNGAGKQPELVKADRNSLKLVDGKFATVNHWCLDL